MSGRRRACPVDDPLAAGDERSPATRQRARAEVAGRLREIPIGRSTATRISRVSGSTRGADSAGGLDPRARRPAADHRPAGETATSSSPASAAGAPPNWPGRRRSWRSSTTQLDQAGSLELALIENIVREDLSPIEQARTFSVLLDDLRITSDVLSRRIGRSRADIVNTMRLLDLPDEVVDMIDTGELTKGHGKVLLTEPDHQRRVSRSPGGGTWVVGPRARGEISRAAKPAASRRPPDPDQCAVATRLEEAITRAIGCEAKAKPHRGGFQILLDQPAADRLARALGADMGAL